MAAVLTGTPVAITWASGANPASQNITIPSDATAVYMFWTFYTSAAGNGLSSVTLNGNAPSQTFEVATAATDQVATGVAAWYNPATGSRALDPAWDGSPGEGPTTIVVFVKDGDTSAWRDADAANETTSSASTVTLTTVSGDLVIKYDQKFGGTAPSLSASWTNGQTTSNNNESARLSYISATGATTVCNSEDEDYSSVCAISIPAAGGASHPTTGALAADAATMAGTATHRTLHATSGALSAQAAQISGAAAHHHAASGALAAQSATMAGTAAHRTLHATSGALQASAATINGTAAHQHATSGALAAAAATIAGTADHTSGGAFDASGALQADAATVAGTAAHLTLHATSGALSASPATISGTAAHHHAAAGALASDAAAISGAAVHTAPGVHATSGTLQASDATLSGSAELQALQPTIRPSGPRPDKDITRLWRTWQGMEFLASGSLMAQPATMGGQASRAVTAPAQPSAAATHAAPVFQASGSLMAQPAQMSGAAARYYRRDGLYRQAPRRELLTEKDARLLARLERVEAELAALRQSTTRTTP